MKLNEFSEEIEKLQKSHNVSFNKEHLKLWWNEFNSLNLEMFSRAVKKTMADCKGIPTIADVRKNITANRMNLNSSYWYANFKDIRPYFNVITGEPLEPYY